MLLKGRICGGAQSRDLEMILTNFLRCVHKTRGKSAMKAKVPPNNALLTDTYSSPLRAQHGAAKRER